MSKYSILLRDTVTIVFKDGEYFSELTVEGLPALNNDAWVLVDHTKSSVFHVKDYKYLLLTNKYKGD